MQIIFKRRPPRFKKAPGEVEDHSYPPTVSFLATISTCRTLKLECGKFFFVSRWEACRWSWSWRWVVSGLLHLNHLPLPHSTKERSPKHEADGGEMEFMGTIGFLEPSQSSSTSGGSSASWSPRSPPWTCVLGKSFTSNSCLWYRLRFKSSSLSAETLLAGLFFFRIVKSICVVVFYLFLWYTKSSAER